MGQPMLGGGSTGACVQVACGSTSSFACMIGDQLCAWGKLKTSGDTTMYPKVPFCNISHAIEIAPPLLKCGRRQQFCQRKSTALSCPRKGLTLLSYTRDCARHLGRVLRTKELPWLKSCTVLSETELCHAVSWTSGGQCPGKLSCADVHGAQWVAD